MTLSGPRGHATAIAAGSPRGGEVYAALDLGTNNCRMLVARPAAGGFQVIDAFSRATRLGEGLAGSGALSDRAMARTVEALKCCAEKMVRRAVTRTRVVATEACRRASNCADFVSRVAEATGLDLEIIAPDEEARLALAGCAPLLDRQLDHALVFDIGGGSTELMHVLMESGGRQRIAAMDSLPLGVVTLTERFGRRLETPEGFAALVEEVTAGLAAFERRAQLAPHVASGRLQMLGTSGTVTTLAAVALGLARYDRAAVDGAVLDFAAVAEASRRLAALGAAGRAAHPCIGRDRADLVVAGCAVFEAIRRVWPAGRLRVADRGVREGVLLGLMRADGPTRWDQ